uniref:Uncharacterized protein n=1 Tax=Rhizophora mucronata TaxID=61149 RepID=A0A2P2ISB4_RHIMU
MNTLGFIPLFFMESTNSIAFFTSPIFTEACTAFPYINLSGLKPEPTITVNKSRTLLNCLASIRDSIKNLTEPNERSFPSPLNTPYNSTASPCNFDSQQIESNMFKR